MFHYDESMDDYISMRRNKVISKNKKTIQDLKLLLNTFRPDEIIYELSFKIIISVERCIDEIYKRPESTLSIISNLRFLFETCINCRLLVLDARFKYILRYSIYQHQIKKSESYLKYANKDIERLDNLINEEEKITQEDYSAEISQKIDELYNALDEEISIFLDMTEFYGATQHKQFLLSYLEGHKEREQRIKNAKNSFEKKLLTDKEANLLFKFDNTTGSIKKQLIDKRTWKSKAIAVGLEEMYSLIYDYTSALIHSTSYSLLIPSQLDKAEQDMIISLGTKITSDILKNIFSFSKVPKMNIVKINE